MSEGATSAKIMIEDEMEDEMKTNKFTTLNFHVEQLGNYAHVADGDDDNYNDDDYVDPHPRTRALTRNFATSEMAHKQAN